MTFVRNVGQLRRAIADYPDNTELRAVDSSAGDTYWLHTLEVDLYRSDEPGCGLLLTPGWEYMERFGATLSNETVPR